ncbi:MAG: hypothetical protein JSS56_08760 [Proteobacteria bacterium]|nr:hypothetical protein [Pseudomonadota bacterium]
MVWAKNVVLVPDGSQKMVQTLGTAMAKRYKAKPQDCFSDVPFTGFQQEGANCVQSDLSTKVIICAHGGKLGLNGNMDADDCASYLKRLGVSQAGLIAFKACSVGKADFLENLAKALNERQIAFGYLIAYRHGTWKTSGGRMRGFWGALEVKGKDKDRVRIVKGNANVQAPGPRYINLTEQLDYE